MNQVFGFQVEEQVSRWRSRCPGGGAGVQVEEQVGVLAPTLHMWTEETRTCPKNSSRL